MWKPETTSLDSRSSGVGQNIREWWVGDKFCVSNGNAIELRWPIDRCQASQKRTMVQGGKKQFKLPSSPEREKCEAYNYVELKNFLCRTDPSI
jgi:hypothetical protein